MVNTIGHRTTDAYLVCYPKSGSTWVQIMLGRYIQMLLNNEDKESPVLLSSFDSFGRCARWAENFPRIQFTHHPLRWDNQVAADLTSENVVHHFNGKSVALLIRSIPDMLVSHYWQAKTQVAPPYEKELADFIRDPVFGAEKAVAFYKIWYENRDAFKNLELFRYEDFRANPNETFKRLLRFWKIPVNDLCAARAVEYADFDNMKKLEASGTSLRFPSSNLPIFPTRDTSKSPESFHVRKGKVGGAKEYLSDADITWLKNTMHGQLPVWYGYTDGFPETPLL